MILLFVGLEHWIAQLGADSFEEREAAMAAILAYEGDPAPFLHEPAQSEDLEVAARARLLIREITGRRRMLRQIRHDIEQLDEAYQSMLGKIHEFHLILAQMKRVEAGCECGSNAGPHFDTRALVNGPSAEAELRSLEKRHIEASWEASRLADELCAPSRHPLVPAGADK